MVRPMPTMCQYLSHTESGQGARRFLSEQITTTENQSTPHPNSEPAIHLSPSVKFESKPISLPQLTLRFAPARQLSPPRIRRGAAAVHVEIPPARQQRHDDVERRCDERCGKGESGCRSGGSRGQRSAASGFRRAARHEPVSMAVHAPAVVPFFQYKPPIMTDPAPPTKMPSSR